MIRNELLEKEYNGNVLEDVCDIIDTAQKVAHNAVNVTLVQGNWVLGKPHVILCIPRLNSFFIIPDSDARYKESSAPTTIIQFSNCISVMPMILSMNEVPDKEKEGVINIAMAYEMLQVANDNEESPQ